MCVRLVFPVFILSSLILMACGGRGEPSVDFNADVRPILSDRCWNCHGPDEESREAELRLDIKDGWKGMEDELYARITSNDPDDVMPPPESNLSLTEAEIETLRQWIDQGADWQPHWAFIPPRQTAQSSTKQEWGNNQIDQFVWEKWQQKGFTPSSPADKATLLRRTSFDLTGLPPTPDELDAFLADESPEAFEKVLDRLFASPHYGEHMAVDWLDVARYADTHGYQADAYRPHWPWRDWVIEAFQDNMPFDQFVSWQVAGDQMPQPARDQLIATGFNRNHAQNGEGGIVQEEFRVEYVADRTQTFGTAFLGLTMQCARCHDHKYDPISQKEFYSLFGFFNQVPEAGQITWNFSDMPGPTMLLSEPDQEKELHRIRQDIQQQEAAIETYETKELARIKEWLDRKSHTNSDFPPGLIAHFPLERATPVKLQNRVNPKQSGKVIDPLNGRLVESGLEIIKGKNGKGVLLRGDEALTFPKIGRFSRADAFSIGMWVNIPSDLDNGVIFHSNKGTALYTFKGYQVSVEDNQFDVRIAHDFPASSIHLLSQDSVPRDRWVHLMLTYDGSSKASGTHLFVDGKAEKMSVERDHLHKDIIFHPKEAGGGYIQTMLKIGARWRGKGFTKGQVDEVLVFDRALQAAEVAAIASETSWEEAVQAGAAWLPGILAQQDQTYQRMQDSLRAKRWQEVRLTESFPELMIMEDQEDTRPTFVLTRGVYDAQADEVNPTTPESVLPFPKKSPNNRLGLTHWLFHPENPLPARVVVNRFWQHYFGRGLVKTTEDFGSQGELPSHPALLDWLALEFEASGWDVQYLQRLMLESATYQQSSYADESLLAEDPDNQWLARGPKSRLSAEMMRDQVLAVSGLLVNKVGGPPVHPYQPQGWWTLNRMSGTYAQGKGEDLYRRSMYTFWKRTNPPPSMNTFDAPDRSYCVVRRQKTTTPLQALVLMNDPQFLEAARVLGERMMREGGKSPQERITFAYRLLTSAFPSQKELDLLIAQFEESLGQYSKDPSQTSWLANTGEHPLSEELNPAEVAAYAVLASTMMNLDASMIKR